MASRLHLDIGKRQLVQVLRQPQLINPTERVRLSHDRANEGSKARAVDNFRGITFDNWLRLFMQVRTTPIYLRRKDLINP